MAKISTSLTPPPTAQVLAINIVLYSFMALFALGTMRRTDLQRLASVPKFLALTALLRTIWFGSEYAGWGDTAGCKDPKAVVSFCGRLAALSLFAAFSSVMFFWWDVLRADPKALNGVGASASEGLDPTEQILVQESTWRKICKPRTVDLLLNFWVFAVLGGLFLYKMFTCDDAARQAVSDAEIVAIAFFMGLLAIGFGIVGSQLSAKLALRESVSSSQLQFRIIVISVSCVVLFSLRCALFSLYPVFGVKLKGAARDALYPWMFYTVPEIVPSLVVLVFLMKRRKISVALEDALLLAPSEHSNAAENSLRVFRV